MEFFSFFMEVEIDVVAGLIISTGNKNVSFRSNANANWKREIMKLIKY